MSDLPARLRKLAALLPATTYADGMLEAADALERVGADLLAAETHILSLADQVAEQDVELQALRREVTRCPFHSWQLP